MGRRTYFGSVGRLALLATVALLPTACNMTPDYKRPQQDMPGTYRNPLPDPSPDLPRPLSEWWKTFGSPELDALVDEALANNRDIKAATQRIIQAEAQAGSSASSFLPSITFSASKSTDSPQGGQGTTITGNTNRTHRLQTIGMAASYELDLWGKLASAEASSLATALANVHDRETLAITMVSDLVSTYLQYLESLDREAVARQNIANMKTMHAAVRERVRLGESSELELAQQRNVLAQGEATIPPLSLQRERAFNKIATLLGRAPSRLTLTGKTLNDLKIPEVVPGLPSDLLLRRPDIKKAEANLIAANANVGVARAKMLPSFTLTGGRGWASQVLDYIASPASIYWTVAGSLAATVFDNGKTEADIAYAKARFEELLETYQQAILASLRDVEDALASIRLEGELEVAQKEVLLASLDAYRLSSEAFRLGMVDYLNVLETQRTRFQAEDAKVQSRFGRMSAVVALYKALGGGMERPEEPAAEEQPKAASASPVETVPPNATEPAKAVAPVEAESRVVPAVAEDTPRAAVEAQPSPPVLTPAASYYTDAN
ncbi:RND transporter [Paramagnetospirillum kuznetsovii]|uniref:RND transporter n=1 Tax=Paramagnetospirillum kuznetsovii TaxID=2053833 RepID=A0A364NVQ1_9PROT|nr:efflux transporter outer membrane subunit [Paramagnetospirillum kuznetsovii]RAU21161.1 RND transporter [Paramagnetospirillum kuznetsovii]